MKDGVCTKRPSHRDSLRDSRQTQLTPSKHLANCTCNSEMAKTNSHRQFVATATVKGVIWMAKDSKLRIVGLIYSDHRREGKRHVDW